MNLVAYADESGSHVGPDSELFIVAGLVGLREDWAKFCAEWQGVLSEFSVPHFHFREWSAASAVARNERSPDSGFKKNPFCNWDQPRLDGLLFKLASVAASGNKIIVGGYVPANQLREDKLSGFVTTKDGPRELCVSHFFDSVTTTINRHRKPWKSLRISFIFEHQETNAEWEKILRTGFYASRDKNRKFRDIATGYKEDHLPLQAADMIAYRLRQRIEKHVKLDFSDTAWPKLDNILFKSFNEWSGNLSEAEKDAMLRRFFVVPEGVTYEQAVQSLSSSRRDRV